MLLTGATIDAGIAAGIVIDAAGIAIDAARIAIVAERIAFDRTLILNFLIRGSTGGGCSHFADLKLITFLEAIWRLSNMAKSVLKSIEAAASTQKEVTYCLVGSKTQKRHLLLYS